METYQQYRVGVYARLPARWLVHKLNKHRLDGAPDKQARVEMETSRPWTWKVSNFPRLPRRTMHTLTHLHRHRPGKFGDDLATPPLREEEEEKEET